MTKHKMLILNSPDCMVDLESSNFFLSSSGKYDQERLEFLAENVLPAWGTHVFSLHQFAEYASQFGLELWSAPDVGLTALSDKKPFAFWIHFTQKLQGDVLVQCELISCGQVH
ncbi:hypothetical protein QJU87_04250 [Pasteurella skyensis]|uniref:hypothetical protein n=1 Tax=Phocoenobacter skyensis TaxID=97481 RepID=UPI0027723DE5|nr:hypothetical protein [Pasteurella skyensis]MDP8189076.1 hypothetical protein [Pasteurella skyensis]